MCESLFRNILDKTLMDTVHPTGIVLLRKSDEMALVQVKR